MSDKTFVVAGNALSLAEDKTGRVLASDTMVRVNNFFFEPLSYLGRRVDLAVMGGDPRVARFMFKTLWQQRHFYDLRSWTSHNPKVMRAGQKRFANLSMDFPTTPPDGRPSLSEKVGHLITTHNCKPMTGTYAVLCAYHLGAEAIIMTGFDFYQGAKRYAYDAGAHQTGLLGADLNTRAIDSRQHNSALDLAILEEVQTAMKGRLFRIGAGTVLDQIMDRAPLREGQGLEVVETNAPKDWASFDGIYPLAALRAMRRVRGWMRR